MTVLGAKPHTAKITDTQRCIARRWLTAGNRVCVATHAEPQFPASSRARW